MLFVRTYGSVLEDQIELSGKQKVFSLLLYTVYLTIISSIIVWISGSDHKTTIWIAAFFLIGCSLRYAFLICDFFTHQTTKLLALYFSLIGLVLFTGLFFYFRNTFFVFFFIMSFYTYFLWRLENKLYGEFTEPEIETIFIRDK